MHSEAAYPEILCNRIASLLKAETLRQGALEVDNVKTMVKHQSKSTNRIVPGALPRGQQIQPLVSEFGTYINVTFDVQFGEALQQFLRRGQPYNRVFLLLGVRHGTRFKKQSKIKLLERKLQVLKNLRDTGRDSKDAIQKTVQDKVAGKKASGVEKSENGFC